MSKENQIKHLVLTPQDIFGILTSCSIMSAVRKFFINHDYPADIQFVDSSFNSETNSVVFTVYHPSFAVLGTNDPVPSAQLSDNS